MSVNGFGETPQEQNERYARHDEQADRARHDFNSGKKSGNGGGNSSCMVTLLVLAAGGTGTLYGVCQLLF